MAERTVARLVSDASPSAPNPTEQKIRSYAQRQAGWHFGEGMAFDKAVVDRAVDLYRRIARRGHYRTNAFPGLLGEIIVTIYHLDRYYEFAVVPDGSLLFSHEVGDDELAFREKISLDRAIDIIRTIRTGAWTSSDSYAESTMMRIVADSRAGPSPTRARMAVFRSSTESVWKSQAAGYAHTSGLTMRISEATPQYSGDSRTRTSRPTPA